jgi:hypothetical protein
MRNSIDAVIADIRGVPEAEIVDEAGQPGVSWAAVVGGALVIAALSLILLALGAGLGFASVSPWLGTGASASTIGVSAILWLIVMQIIASAMGGYLAGRLRTKWARIHGDEVYFRDTAHGFLAWALAAVLTAAFLASAAASIVGDVGSSNNLAAAPSAAPSADIPIPMGSYFVDKLFRSEQPAAASSDASVRSEAGRILANAVIHKDAPVTDRTYLSHLIALRTGLSQPEADKRVSDVITDAQAALDSARKTAMHISIWSFVALLCGAFAASVSATIGGRQRDHVVVV